MSNAITEFRGKNFFLSNFYVVPVVYQGIRFENNEAAFQAAKCPERMRDFCGLNPQSAKRLGRRIELRSDWEEVKFDVMYQVCRAKFLQNPELAKMLIETGDAELVEGNTWGDRIWGVCNGVGENSLGKILMRIRTELANAGLAPVLCNAGSNPIHHHYFGCPVCGSEIGGFTITGAGEDDWGTHEDKFCSECGQKIDWSNVEWSTIYRC